MGVEWVAPAIAGTFLLLAGIVTAITSIVTSRRTADVSKAPTAEQAWREADDARRRARLWEDLYYLVRGAFKGYGRRMTETHGETAAALNDQERAALEAPIPDPDA